MEPRAAAEPLDHVVWSTTLNTARDMADGGRYGMADALLARYALANPDSPSAHESDFWRALILLDPDNPLTSSAARVLLERYLGYDDGMHRDEARVLLAVAASRDSMRALLAARDAALRAQATAPHPGDREAELLKENQALHDQLEKTQAELDRIKKRLVAPKP
ncbi:MAG TPA: hypothetical protein VFK13_00630 [Gemmatimonadaceae bacterium]|nr:hypothetical protein [Gemmatimonadaceae bacterium]